MENRKINHCNNCVCIVYVSTEAKHKTVKRWMNINIDGVYTRGDCFGCFRV